MAEKKNFHNLSIYTQQKRFVRT